MLCCVAKDKEPVQECPPHNSFLQGLLKVVCLLGKHSEVFLCSSDFSLEVKKPRPMLYSQLSCVLLDTWFVGNLTACLVLCSLKLSVTIPQALVRAITVRHPYFLPTSFLLIHPLTQKLYVSIFHPVLLSKNLLKYWLAKEIPSILWIIFIQMWKYKRTLPSLSLKLLFSHIYDVHLIP